MNESYPPFFAQDASGKWHGWEIDLMDAVCAEMKEKCSIVALSWDGLIPALESKKFDVIWSSMSNTAERQKVIDFTNKYYNTPSKLIGAKDGKPGATAEDVKGKTIGIQVATIQSNYYAKYFKDVADEKTYQTLDEAFRIWPPAASIMSSATRWYSTISSRPTPAKIAAPMPAMLPTTLRSWALVFPVACARTIRN